MGEFAIEVPSNKISCPGNWSTQIQETHASYSAGTQYTRQSLNEKTTYMYNKLLSVKPCMLFFIQTLPRILCAGAIRCVSFLDLLGLIAGATNPITWHFYCESHKPPAFGLNKYWDKAMCYPCLYLRKTRNCTRGNTFLCCFWFTVLVHSRPIFFWTLFKAARYRHDIGGFALLCANFLLWHHYNECYYFLFLNWPIVFGRTFSASWFSAAYYKHCPILKNRQ